MSEIIVQEVAVKKSGQAPPRIKKNQAVSYLAPFGTIKSLLEGYPAPKRPSRNRPVNMHAHDRDEMLRSLTPSNEDLRKVAEKFRPPDAWLEGDEDRPF
jgi:hypothetical protein